MIKNVTRHKKTCKGYNQGKNACCTNVIALNPFTTIGIYNVVGFYWELGGRIFVTWTFKCKPNKTNIGQKECAS